MKNRQNHMNPLIHLKKATPSFVGPFMQKRRTTVKRIFSLLFVLAVVVTTTSTGYAQCSDATLTGSYAFNFHGFNTRSGKEGAKLGNEIPFADVGVVTFDGAGNLSVTGTFVFNNSGGQPIGPDTGTYTVNSDCTGTATDDTAGIHFDIVTVGGGKEFFGVETDIGTTGTIDGKKQ
jgi:hypothetical protein